MDTAKDLDYVSVDNNGESTGYRIDRDGSVELYIGTHQRTYIHRFLDIVALHDFKNGMERVKIT